MWFRGLISGGCCFPGPCQSCGTQHSFFLPLAFPARTYWHRVILFQGTSSPSSVQSWAGTKFRSCQTVRTNAPQPVLCYTKGEWYNKSKLPCFKL